MSRHDRPAIAWQVLVGLFEPELIEAECERCDRNLLVPNNDRQLSLIQSYFGDQLPASLWVAPDYVGPFDGMAVWHQYNDRRFDGIQSPSDVQRIATNVKPLSQNEQPIVRLENLVGNWTAQDLRLPDLLDQEVGRVWLCCKDPEPILAGAAGLAEAIQELCWTPLGAHRSQGMQARNGETPAPRLDWEGFEPAEQCSVSRHCPSLGFVWRQDPVRTACMGLRAQLANARAEHAVEAAELRNELSTLREDHRRLTLEAERRSVKLEMAERELETILKMLADKEARSLALTLTDQE